MMDVTYDINDLIIIIGRRQKSSKYTHTILYWYTRVRIIIFFAVFQPKQ